MPDTILDNQTTYKKISLANKDSYFRKHKEKISENAAGQSRLPTVQVTDDVKALFEEGRVILIDKPIHWTSFDVVRKIRNSIRIKKVGHAGTLDPLATGLLIICTGKFTKKINEYMSQEKEYTGSFTLGAVTATFDKESDPEQQKDITGISIEKIGLATQQFIGEIQQVPPVYSAIKKEGTALYVLARRGEAVAPEPRTVFISVFEITGIELPLVYFKIVCSTGTYIRSIANDFGAVLGCGAYLSELRRTRIGELDVKDAVTMEGFIGSLIHSS